MRHSYLLLTACLVYLFTACEPDFSLNAPYKDVTVVYGILNYQDSVQYVKIYKGFQSNESGGAFINAQNPDSIYYYDDINVVLQEYKDGRRTLRPNIRLGYTHDFPRDAGTFYYGDERIIYYTPEPILKDMSYKIIITNKITGQVTEGQTPIVDDFKITSSGMIDMLANPPKGVVSFSKAKHASGYEIHVNFVYFEVDKRTNEVVKIDRVVKNITPRTGERFQVNGVGDFMKDFAYTFYDDIAAQLRTNDDVIRFVGLPGKNGSCIEIEGWAAGESMINFLVSNQPTGSFAQINTIYTNMETSEDGLAFGFLSSRVKTLEKDGNTVRLAITPASELELIRGPKTGHLGFRPWTEYRPNSN